MDSSFHDQITDINSVSQLPENMQFHPKVESAVTWVLLKSYQTLHNIIFYFSIFPFNK